MSARFVAAASATPRAFQFNESCNVKNQSAGIRLCTNDFVFHFNSRALSCLLIYISRGGIGYSGLYVVHDRSRATPSPFV